MGLLSRLASRAGRGVIRRAGKAANIMDGLANYALITGSLGGLGGMLMGASDAQEQGETPEQINEAAMYGGRTGAMGGPLAFGPAIAMTAGLGPMGAMPLVPWALYTGSDADRPQRERLRKAMEEEAVRRAMAMRVNQADRRY